MNHIKPLLDILDLTKTSECSFVGSSLDIGSPRVYGGQVLAQAIVAAYKTVPENKRLHSLHGYFLEQGEISQSIRYEVSAIRDGRSFSVRRVTAFQKERMIYIMAGSFQIEETGLEHQKIMPNVAHPEYLNSFPDILATLTEKTSFKPRGLFSESSPIVFHPVEKYNPFDPGKQPPLGHVWFKPSGQIPDSYIIHQALMAYASDFSLLITSLQPHQVSIFKTPMFLASLDHSMWFHRQILIEDWLLYALESPNTSSARGFCTGQIFSKDGKLIISVAQEGLIRLKNYVKKG